VGHIQRAGVDALQCGSFMLVGHGLGAMLVALRQPALVLRLVLCAPGPGHARLGAPRLPALQAVADAPCPRRALHHGVRKVAYPSGFAGGANAMAAVQLIKLFWNRCV
jgi:pimeloyl-ACP methyl ester carboxylesterase